MVHCISYNCNSIRNNSEIVKCLLREADILCLQEIMLTKDDLGVLNQFDPDFEHVAYVNDRENCGINEGRPTAGVAIFWRRQFSHCIKPVIVDASIIGIILDNGSDKVLIMNVYLPCDYRNLESLDKYRNALAQLESVIREQNINNCMVMGDCNADPFKGRFWKDLVEFCSSLSLSVCDSQLPNDSFTYLCPAYNTSSWLDHILCTKEISLNVSNVFINYDISAFDHFPLQFDFKFDFNISDVLNEEEVINSMVNWSDLKNIDIECIKAFIDNAIDMHGLLCHELFSCTNTRCSNSLHIKFIDDIFDFMKNVLLCATESYSVQRSRNFKIIPGWNDYLKHFHAEARRHFLLWKSNGKPLTGIFVDNMKSSRSMFKRALNECKDNENAIRRQKLLDKLHKKDYKGFWKEVDLIRNNNINDVDSVDGLKDKSSICEMFSDKYKRIFSNNNISMTEDVSEERENTYFRISHSDINNGINQLKPSIGMDGIHANHLRFCPDSYRYLISELFSSFSRHEYVTKSLIKGSISPTVKDKFGNLGSSDNYRPVMISSVFFKLLEYCLLPKISPYIELNDRQHGFRGNYSTTTACFVLKETILNYFSSSSDVHACFLDISKAFDSVNHDVLMKKLLNCGIPNHYVMFLKYLYSNQFVSVRYKSCMSQEWRVDRGVRQGGVLSGLLFSIYINDLVYGIANLKEGCRMGILSSNIIAYADDIVLLAPSKKGLQILLDKAVEESQDLNFNFNDDKSKYMIFRHSKVKVISSSSVYIGNSKLEKVEAIKYLGFTMNSF